jgi:hypothetical protein
MLLLMVLVIVVASSMSSTCVLEACGQFGGWYSSLGWSGLAFTATEASRSVWSLNK